jgi:lysophospholipase L1-like esterase
LESILPIKSKIICSKGATSLEILRLLDFNSTTYIPDLVIAQSGINDLIEGLTEEETLDAQDNLLNKIRSKYANANVIFLPIHPFFKEEKFISSTLSSSENSFSNCWKNATSFRQNYLMVDGIHLNARGHSHLANAIAKEFQNLYNL